MADYYWVGGSGTWDSTSTTNWASTSGGAGGAGVPTSADNAYFDGNSDTGAAFTVTIGTGAVCKDYIVGDGTTVSVLDQTMTLGGSAALNIHGSWFNPATNYTRVYTGTIAFVAVTTGQVVTTNGIQPTTNTVTFNGVGGGWTFGSAYTSNNSFILNAGSLDTASYNVTAARFQITGTGVKSLSLGSSLMSCAGGSGGDGWTVTGSNVTLNAGTSTIRSTSVLNPPFVGGGLTYYTVDCTIGSGGWSSISGVNTFTNLTLSGLAYGGGRYYVGIQDNQTITGTFTVSAGAFSVVTGISLVAPAGTQRTITAANIVIGENVNIRGIIGAGAAAPWDLSSLYVGDVGDNENIIFRAPQTVYWNLAGNHSWGANGWALTPAGAPNLRNTPLPQDTAVFTDLGAVTSFTISTGPNLIVGNFVFDDGVNPRTIPVGFSVNSNIDLYGDIILSPAVILGWASNRTVTVTGNRRKRIRSAGKEFASAFFFSYGEFFLEDNFTHTNPGAGTFTLSGTTNANAKAVININNKILSGVNISGTFTSGSFHEIDFGDTGVLRLGASLDIPTGSFTSKGSRRCEMTYSGSVGTRSFRMNSGQGENVLDIFVTAGNDRMRWNGAVGTLDFTGFTGTLEFAGLSPVLYRNLVFSPTMSVARVSGATTESLTISSGVAAPTTHTLRTYGIPIPSALLISESYPGGIRILDELTLTDLASGVGGDLDFRGGRIDLNNRVLTARAVRQAASVSSKDMVFGSGQLHLFGTGTIYSSPFTVIPGTGKIVLTADGTTGRTVEFGSVTLPELVIGGTGVSTTTITGSNTFARISSTKTTAHTIVFPNAVTNIADWAIDGSEGNLVTLSRTGGSGSFTLNYSGARYVVTRYISVSNSTTVPENRFYAIYSTDGGNNVGWIFGPPAFSQFLSFFDV
jgi:hypothetical protein